MILLNNFGIIAFMAFALRGLPRQVVTCYAASVDNWLLNITGIEIILINYLKSGKSCQSLS